MQRKIEWSTPLGLRLCCSSVNIWKHLTDTRKLCHHNNSLTHREIHAKAYRLRANKYIKIVVVHREWHIGLIFAAIENQPAHALLGRPERSVPDGLLFYRRCFLGSHISEAPRPIAAKLCHMIAIWLESPAKVGQLGGPPLKNFRGQNMQNFGRFFATSDFDREYLRNSLRYPNRNSKCI